MLQRVMRLLEVPGHEWQRVLLVRMGMGALVVVVVTQQGLTGRTGQIRGWDQRELAAFTAGGMLQQLLRRTVQRLQGTDLGRLGALVPNHLRVASLLFAAVARRHMGLTAPGQLFRCTPLRTPVHLPLAARLDRVHKRRLALGLTGSLVVQLSDVFFEIEISTKPFATSLTLKWLLVVVGVLQRERGVG